MRRILLISGTVLVVAIAFGVFAWLQQDIHVSSQRALNPTTRSATGTQIGAIGRGAGAWVTSFDRNTGLPKTRFHGDEFTPKGGDQILVDHPEAEFYTGRDRSSVIRITGKTGLVIIPGQGPRIRSDFSSTPTQPPSRGSMRDVTVTYFPSRADLEQNHPQLTLTLNNAYFDNETFEIATEDYTDEQGRTILARDVPVVVRGDALDFDGRGLLIRWDDRSNRLRSLTVFHGEQLVLKKGIDALRSRPTTKPVAALPQGMVRLAATDNRIAVKNAAAATTRPGDIYRATFAEDVVVTQEEQTLATAQQLHVDFLSSGSDDRPQEATESPARAAKSARTSPAPAAAPPPAPTDIERHASSPLKKDVPVVIRWSGPLTVTLAPDEPIKPLSSDDAVIHFAGSEGKPVHLRVAADGGENARELEGMWVAYEILTGEARVEGSPASPARISEQRSGNRSFQLSTPQLRVFADGKAVLRGPSTAVITSNTKDGPQTINAAWKELGEATFSGKPGESDITNLHLQGDVNVTNVRIPQFKAGTLDLQFKPGSGSSEPILQQITASRDVDCVIADRNGEKRNNIRCQNLKVAVDQGPDGQPYPSSIDADGSVYAYEDKPGTDRSYIKAQHVRADLVAPSEQQSKRGDEYELAGLRNLHASGQVEMQSVRDDHGKPKRELIKAERVNVVQDGATQHVVLEGAPASILESVNDAQSMLAGGFIEYDSAGQTVQITGGGRLVVPDSSMSKNAKGMPIEITWTGPANISGPKNNITVDGGIRIHYVDASGVINDASGDHIDVTLAANPVEPTTKPAKTGQPDFLSGKHAQQFVLSATQGHDIYLRSLKPGPNNTIARQINILGPRLECSLAPDGKPGRIEIPAPPGGMGRMLYVLLPAATRTPVASKDPLQGNNLAGATAFGWKDRLVYDAAKGQFMMRGDVLVRHEPQSVAGKPFEVKCDTAIADVASGAMQGTAAKAADSADITRLVLTGRPVQIKRDPEELTAATVEYDPKTDDVIAIGSQGDPVQVEKGLKTGSFQSVRMNLKTNAFDVTGASGQGRQAR